MMGSGKSIIGSKFAKIIKFDFIDTDDLIEEKTGKSINQIFDNFGEAYFRNLEEKYISKILLKKNYVISLGGGVMNNVNLRKILKQNSFNIYLCVSNSDLEKRLKNSNKRPLIENKKIKNILDELLKKRENYYNEADLKIENSNTVNQTIDELKKILNVNE
tara:strand:+ start:3900 stop:4382 length:483 start_codon:yes stop_codon:yes gene_type:complete